MSFKKASRMSLKKAKLNVIQKEQIDYSLKRTGRMSLKKAKLIVPQKDQFECPSKRANWMSLKKDNLKAPQKSQLECPSKRAIWMSLKKRKLDVPQKWYTECPSKRARWMSLKKEKLDVQQRREHFVTWHVMIMFQVTFSIWLAVLVFLEQWNQSLNMQVVVWIFNKCEWREPCSLIYDVRAPILLSTSVHSASVFVPWQLYI